MTRSHRFKINRNNSYLNTVATQELPMTQKTNWDIQWRKGHFCRNRPLNQGISTCFPRMSDGQSARTLSIQKCPFSFSYARWVSQSFRSTEDSFQAILSVITPSCFVLLFCFPSFHFQCLGLFGLTSPAARRPGPLCTSGHDWPWRTQATGWESLL